MKKAASLVGLEPTALLAMSSAHRAIHLSHGEWRKWQKLAGFWCYIIDKPGPPRFAPRSTILVASTSQLTKKYLKVKFSLKILAAQNNS